jgi:hypothetical protein
VFQVSRKLLLAGAAAATLVVAVALGGVGALLSIPWCSEDERAVFEEFAQFGGRRLEPEGNPQLDSCAVYYDVYAPNEEILAYYREQLEERGWRIEARGGGENTLVATREEDGYYYQVETEAGEGEGGRRGATHVAAHVARLSEV